MGCAEEDPFVQVWNPLEGRKVLNLGGADFEEGVGRRWWLERRTWAILEEMEVVASLDNNGSGDPPLGGDGILMNPGGP